jgi:hypothetical protein
VSEETEFDWEGEATPYKMRLLDHFASLAMQEIMHSWLRNLDQSDSEFDKQGMKWIAQTSYLMADAMMLEREEKAFKEIEAIIQCEKKTNE